MHILRDKPENHDEEQQRQKTRKDLDAAKDSVVVGLRSRPVLLMSVQHLQ